MPNPTTIELPRIENESAQAYAARVAYVTMGAGRSIDKVADQQGIKTGSRSSRYLEWSRKYGWVDSARQYDEQVHYLTIQDAADKYRADLETHRKKASDAGAALYSVSQLLIKQVHAALSQPKTIKGEDGKFYTLHGLDMTAGTFAIAARAMQTALDLEAHALGVDRILPTIDGDTQD